MYFEQKIFSDKMLDRTFLTFIKISCILRNYGMFRFLCCVTDLEMLAK